MKFFSRKICLRSAILAYAVMGPVALAVPAYAVSPLTTAFYAEKGRTSFSIPVSTEKIGSGAQKFIDGMAQRGLDFLANAGLSSEQKSNEFRKLLQDSFDMETIGRFALGRYWRAATPEQRKEYQKLFREMIVQVYSARFKDYEGQRVETRSFRIDGDNDTIVTSFIIPPDGAEIQVDWRVRHKNNHYQIVDVIVEGVSMSVTQRSDFSSVIQRGGGDVQVLIDHLRK